MSGLIGASGLIAAVGCFRPTSALRAVGAAFLIVAALLFDYFKPLDLFNRPMELKKVLAIAGPLTLTAVWFLFVLLVMRRSRADHVVSSQPPVLPAVSASAFMGAAMLLFGFMNFLQPQTGLWRTIVCLDQGTGDVLWERPDFLAPAGRKYRTNSYATPTPVTDGELVAANFGPGISCATVDGELLWTRMEPEYGDFLRYGAAPSTILYGDLLIHTFMAENPRAGGQSGGPSFAALEQHSYIAGLDKRTGEERWRATPPGGHDSYGTPLLVQDGDRPAILISTYGHALSYDAETGAQLWVARIPIDQPVPSIVADEDTAFVVGGTHGDRVAAAIQLGGRGDVTETHVKWMITKGIPECVSPVLYGGLLYWITGSSILYCVDADTGDIVWRKRLTGQYAGSLVAGDERVYVPATNGDVTVLQAGREAKVLARNAIGEDIYSSPCIANGRIFLRAANHLFCIGAPSAGGS